MKLTTLTVNGFRGFSRKCEFDLSADATVVIGPNGLGKTSLFDAVLWGLSGTLPRVGDDQRIVSLYSENGQARVTVCLRDQNGEMIVNRSSDGEKQSVSLKFNGSEFKGTSATSRLVESLWPEAAVANDQGAALASVLCRSNYLQQDRIREFVESNDDQHRFTVFCELVGTGRLTELQSALESDSRSWAIATTKLSKEGLPLVQRVKDLEIQTEKLRRAELTPVANPSVSWDSWWQTRFEGENMTDRIPSPLSPETTSLITDRLRQLQSIRDHTLRTIATIAQTSLLLQQRPDLTVADLNGLEAVERDANLRLAKLREEIENEKRERARIREEQVSLQESRAQTAALAKLALQLLEEKCPVCAQDYDRETTRDRLKALLATPQVQELESAVLKELAKSEREASEQLLVAQITLRRARQEKGKVDLWQAEVDRKLAELSISSDARSKEALDASREKLSKLEQSLAKHCADGEVLSLGIAKVANAARLNSIEAELVEAIDALKLHEKSIKTRELASDVLRDLISSLRDANSQAAISRLKEIEPFVQRIYSRIDPHPAFQLISFVSTLVRGKGHLNAMLKDRIGEVSSLYPHAVLSSSQLNALALSVFLAFNLAIPKQPLDCALLDDPLQSLDDINLLGVVDLLRRVKDRRQILVSTHDVRFGRLLARKLRPSNDSATTSVIEFSDWTRNGPVFTQKSIEADSTGLRLVRAS